MLETDIAYCAGIIDGEGCIRVKKVAWTRYRKDRTTPGYHASITVKMVEHGALNLLASCFGGTVRAEKRRFENRKPIFAWSISDQKAEDACRLLLPYLRVKHLQASLVLKLRKLQHEGSKHRTKVTGHREFPNQYGAIRIVENRSLSDEYVAWCEAMHVESLRLNKVGV